MRSVRAPVAAGTFYPGRPEDLGLAIDELLAEAKVAGRRRPAALIAPHAGYVYSGPIAASAYALLRGAGARRVAILGPAHFVPLDGCAVPAVDAWRTPLGDVEIDRELRRAVAGPGVALDDGPHEPEHAIEVHLPFLQRALGPELTVLPIAVGVSRPDEIASVIETLPPSVLVVVSTDLSHYHDAEAARRLDRRTADAILARDPDGIGPEDACGAFALRGMLEHARRHGLEVELLDLRNSADTAGDSRRVVGYCAFALR